MKEITAVEAKELIDEQGARLVDGRERDEGNDRRVPGSTLVPLSEYEGDPGRVERGENVIFICAKGIRSQAAAAIYESAWQGAEGYSVKGGIGSWAGRAFPTGVGPPQPGS